MTYFYSVFIEWSGYVNCVSKVVRILVVCIIRIVSPALLIAYWSENETTRLGACDLVLRLALADVDETEADV